MKTRLRSEQFVSAAAASIALCALATCCFAQSTPMAPPARRTPDQVLLVINAQSEISRNVGYDYARRRRVTNIVLIDCADSALNASQETIALADYTKSIENPIRSYLASHPNIDFIVTTKGVPIRISGAATGEDASGTALVSLDSYLAALDYDKIPGAVKVHFTAYGSGYAWSNRYYGATEPFSHAKFGGYLVTRLDGYTEADAESLVSRSLAAEQTLENGEVLLDVQPQFGLGDKSTQPAPFPGTTMDKESPWSGYNADMAHAADVLTTDKRAVELDLNPDFVGYRAALLGYFSWGSNDPHYSANAYHTLFFAPGALSDTAVSTSARTFLPTRGGQSLIADLIAQGVTGIKGYTDEPLLQANASPTILWQRYLSGYTLAESFYAASHLVGWEDVVIGDPLCCPYAAHAHQ